MCALHNETKSNSKKLVHKPQIIPEILPAVHIYFLIYSEKKLPETVMAVLWTVSTCETVIRSCDSSHCQVNSNLKEYLETLIIENTTKRIAH